MSQRLLDDVDVSFEPDMTMVYAGVGLLTALHAKGNNPDKNYDLEIAGATLTLLVAFVASHVRTRPAY